MLENFFTDTSRRLRGTLHQQQRRFRLVDQDELDRCPARPSSNQKGASLKHLLLVNKQLHKIIYAACKYEKNKTENRKSLWLCQGVYFRVDGIDRRYIGGSGIARRNEDINNNGGPCCNNRLCTTKRERETVEAKPSLKGVGPNTKTHQPLSFLYLSFFNLFFLLSTTIRCCCPTDSKGLLEGYKNIPESHRFLFLFVISDVSILFYLFFQ